MCHVCLFQDIGKPGLMIVQMPSSAKQDLCYNCNITLYQKNYLTFEVFLASLNRNGEFAHPETENVILGLLCSEISEERNLGVKLIIKIRNKLKDRRRVWPRQFKVGGQAGDQS